MAGPRLTVIDDPTGRVVAVSESLTIGRADGNDLVIEAAAVSRRHARILKRGATYVIEDLKSAHGTTVNGERVTTRELRSGDLVGLGPVALRFETGDGTAPPRDSADVLIARRTDAPSRASIPARGRTGASTTHPDAAVRRLEGIINVALALQGEREVGRLFERTCRLLLDALAVDRCAIFVRGESGPALVLSKTGAEAAGDLPFSRTLLGRAMDGEALVTADAGRDARFAGASLAAGTVRSAMVAPLWGRERVLGAVVVENRGTIGAFDAIASRDAASSLSASVME